MTFIRCESTFGIRYNLSVVYKKRVFLLKSVTRLGKRSFICIKNVWMCIRKVLVISDKLELGKIPLDQLKQFQ